MLPDGSIVTCGRDENLDLFRATCGGMGLTGVILDAKIQLKKIKSKHINQTTIKTKNLRETFEAFEKYGDKPYSVAWIDCLSKGDALGRCLLMVGDFSDDGNLQYRTKRSLNVPIMFPSFTLNSFTIKAFNWLYYNRVRKAVSQQKVILIRSFIRWTPSTTGTGFTAKKVLPSTSSFCPKR